MVQYALFQWSPAECGVSKCDRDVSIMMRPWPTRGCCAMEKTVCTSCKGGGRGGTRWPSWLRHCATSRKVEGLIPDVAIGIFH